MKQVGLLILGLLVFVCSALAKSENVNFPSGNIILKGTLHLPATAGPYPVIILVHGSGPSDRNQEIEIVGGNAQCLYPNLMNQTIEMFGDMAKALSDSGFAVLTYDKRTFSYPGIGGDQASVYDFEKDIHSAVDYLKTRTDINTNRIVLLGHSQGANLVPVVANSRQDIHSIISMGAGAMGIDTIFSEQIREIYYKCLNDTLLGDSIYVYLQSNFAIIKAGNWPLDSLYMGAYPKFWNDWIEVTSNAISEMEEVSIPKLIVQAEEDFNVPLIHGSIFQSFLTPSTYDLYTMSGLNHYFTTQYSPKVTESTTDTIVDWLRKLDVLSSVSVLKSEDSFSIKVENSAAAWSIVSSVNYRLDIVQLYDTKGRLIRNKRGNNYSIVRVEKPKNPGLYLLKVKNQNGQWVVKKLLVD